MVKEHIVKALKRTGTALATAALAGTIALGACSLGAVAGAYIMDNHTNYAESTPTLDLAYQASLMQYTPTQIPTIAENLESLITPMPQTPQPGQTPVMSTPYPRQTPVQTYQQTPVMPTPQQTPAMPTPQQTPMPTLQLILEPTPQPTINNPVNQTNPTMIPATPIPTNSSIPYTASMTQKLIRELGDLWQLPFFDNTSMIQCSAQNFVDPERYWDYFVGSDWFTSDHYGCIGFDGNFRNYRIVNGEYEMLATSGPGYISRIWLRTPVQHNNPAVACDNTENNCTEWGNMSGNIRFYFDGETLPSIDMPLRQFFDGSNSPFLEDLVGHYRTRNGGTVSYVPMPFRDSVRVTTTELPNSFQIAVKRFNNDPGYFESFRLPLNPAEQRELEKVVQIWQNRGQIPYYNVSNDVRNNNYNIAAFSNAELRLDAPGTIQELRIRVPMEQVSDLELMLFWDNNPNPAVQAPLQAFFGTRELLLPYRALPMGTDINSNEVEFYNFLPMPYNNARIVIANNRGDAVPVNLNVRVGPQHPSGARFHAQVKQERMQASTDLQGNYVAANISGRGKFLGIIFTGYDLDRHPAIRDEQLSDTWPLPYLESNINGFVDGLMMLPDTGAEDFANAGWYFVNQDVPGLQKQFPEAGCIIRDRTVMNEMTSLYRFYLTDSPEFQNNYSMEVEHGFYLNNLSVTYSSTAFWYQY